MRIALSAFLAFTGTAAVALAQTPSPRPFRVPPGHDKDKAKEKDDDGRQPRAGTDPQACRARRAILDTEQQRADAYRVELAGVDGEVQQLQRRLDELRRRREDTQRLLTVADRRVSSMQQMYRRECQANETCATYEQQAAALDAESQRVELELTKVQDEIGQNRAATAVLEQRIAPLQREYAEKRCSNLVAGETQQTVIDRCTAIFSDWNRMQADLNRQNSRVPELKGRYGQLAAVLQSIEARAGSYEQYLAKNCVASLETEKLRGYPKKRERARTVERELDELIADLARLRGIRITVSPD